MIWPVANLLRAWLCKSISNFFRLSVIGTCWGVPGQLFENPSLLLQATWVAPGCDAQSDLSQNGLYAATLAAQIATKITKKKYD